MIDTLATTPSALLLAVVAFLLAGLVKGVIGLGLPTVAIGLLSMAMTPAQAAALLVVPSLMTNLWQLGRGPRLRAILRRLWPMMAAIPVGTLAGGGLIVSNGREAVAALGVALLAYAGLGLARIRFSVPPRAERWLAPAVGLATGLVTAATGVFVIPAVPYLQALDLDKDELVQALGLSFTVSTAALAVTLAREGAFAPAVAGASLLALAPALAGMALGQWVRGRVSERTFRLCFFLGLLVLGAHLAGKAL